MMNQYRDLSENDPNSHKTVRSASTFDQHSAFAACNSQTSSSLLTLHPMYLIHCLKMFAAPAITDILTDGPVAPEHTPPQYLLGQWPILGVY